MATVISTLEEATPEWLTAILRREQMLPRGQVRAIEAQPNEAAFNSNTAHLTATFSAETPSWAPNRFLLKRNIKAAWAIRAGIREVAFYQTVASLPNHPKVIVRCYDAAHDHSTGDSHILLQDLSESHLAPVTRDQRLDNLLAEEYLEQAIDTLGRFHAFWWESPHLGAGIAQIGTWCRDREHFSSEVERRRAAWNHLLAEEGDWLPPPLLVLYENILAQMLPLWEKYTRPRLASFSHMTLTHGDVYLANFLCPQSSNQGPTYLIDWQSPEVYRGTGDLVNMLATFWTRTYRVDREGRMLKRYHRVLQENGVTSYTWDDLVADYQYSIIDWLLIPLQDCLDGSTKDYWYPKMQCLADAFADWNCAQLFVQG